MVTGESEEDEFVIKSKIQKGEVPDVPQEAKFLSRNVKSNLSISGNHRDTRVRRTKEGTILRGRGATRYQKTEDQFTYRRDKVPEYVEKVSKRLVSSNKLDEYFEKKEKEREKKDKDCVKEIPMDSGEQSSRKVSPPKESKEDNSNRKSTTKERSTSSQSSSLSRSSRSSRISSSDDIQNLSSPENLHKKSRESSVSSYSSSYSSDDSMTDSKEPSPTPDQLVDKPLSHYKDRIPPPSMKWKHGLVDEKPPPEFLKNRSRRFYKSSRDNERNFDEKQSRKKTPSPDRRKTSPSPGYIKGESTTPIDKKRSRTPPYCRSRTPNDRIKSRSSFKHSSSHDKHRRSSLPRSMRESSSGSNRRRRSYTKSSSPDSYRGRDRYHYTRTRRRERSSSSSTSGGSSKSIDQRNTKKASKSPKRRSRSVSSSNSDKSIHRHHKPFTSSGRKRDYRRRSPDRKSRRWNSRDRDRYQRSTEYDGRQSKRKRYCSDSHGSSSSYDRSKRRDTHRRRSRSPRKFSYR